MTIRIGQLTDIHIYDGSDLRRRDFITKRATGWYNYKRKRAHEYSAEVIGGAVERLIDAAPDLVLVTGDLTNLGLRSELRAARLVLQPLSDAGLTVRVFPGNHDYYVASSSRGAFEEELADLIVADARVDDEPYPYVVRVGHVSVLCLNTAIPVPPLFAYGRLGAGQLARANELATAEAGRPLVLALHHHPVPAPHKRFDFMRNLRDAASLRRFAARHDARLVLHGHNHYFDLRRIDRDDGPLVVGLSSSTTRRSDHDARHGQVGLYTIDDHGGVTVETARWSEAEGGFGEWAQAPTEGLPIVSS